MLKEIVKIYLEPTLTDCGFKKNDFTWNRSVDGIVQVINIQLSRFNNRHEENFTINLGIFNPLIWKKCWLREIPKIIREEDCFPRLRISELQNTTLDKKTDFWWNCTLETDEVSLAEELTDLIVLKCIPFLNNMLDPQSIKELYKDKAKNLLPIEKIYFAILNRQIDDHIMENILLDDVSSLSASWAKRVSGIRDNF